MKDAAGSRPHTESIATTPHLRRTPRTEIRTLSVGPLDNNAYLLTCRSTGAQALIDAAAEPDRLIELITLGSAHRRLDLLVTTHRHTDHIGALRDVADATGALVAVGADDADAVEQATTVRVGRRLVDGDMLNVGDLQLTAIALRGHTPGSFALALPGGARTFLFTGDSLFPGGLGNTGGKPERFEQLYSDVTSRIFDRYANDSWVCPGHGQDTTLGAERPHLGEWHERGW